MAKLIMSGVLVNLVVVLCVGCAEINSSPMLSGLLSAANSGQVGGLSESTIAAGLKEALRVGSERTVASTSVEDGFLGNALIRIPMPEQLTGVASTLRQVGMGSQVDQVEVAMNRAAEQASGEAKAVLWQAVTDMTLTDAVEILNGSETAATDYFRTKTSATLKRRFTPIVQQKMEQVGLYNTYHQLMSYYQALPFTQKPQFDLDRYVADRAQQGLFITLAQEEQKIRRDPAQRTSELLKKVFALQD